MNRILAAQQGIPDRVPVYGQIHEFAMKQLGIHPKVFYSDGKALVEAIVETAQKYGVDDPHICYDTYNIECEAMGMEVRWYDYQAPQLIQSNPLVKEKSDLEKLKPPIPGEDGRMPFVVEVFETYQKFIEQPKGHPSLSYTAPFTLATRIRGVEAFLMDTLTDPTFAHDLLAFLTEEVLIPWVKCLQKINKKSEPIIGGADALASPPLLSVPAMREFVLPYILKIREACGGEGSVQNYWGESMVDSPEDLLAVKKEASPKLIIGQDPDVEKLGPELFKAYAEKNDITLTLGLGAEFLMMSTPEQIKKRVKHYIDVGGKGGRFLLYLCNAAGNTPPENVKAVADAVEEFGYYN